MNDTEHRQRHVELHAKFDELLADWINNTKGSTNDSIFTLMEWSHRQTKLPVPDHPVNK